MDWSEKKNSVENNKKEEERNKKNICDFLLVERLIRDIDSKNLMVESVLTY